MYPYRVYSIQGLDSQYNIIPKKCIISDHRKICIFILFALYADNLATSTSTTDCKNRNYEIKNKGMSTHFGYPQYKVGLCFMFKLGERPFLAVRAVGTGQNVAV